jgi:phage gp36-like protein
MRILIAPTEDFIKLERTELSDDVSAGSNITLPLLNNNGLAENEFIVIGREGGEKAELEQINAAVSGATDVRVATLKYAHKKGEPVVKYRFNKRKFYGSLTATGTYTELTADGSPVAIQVDDPQGTLLEYSGGEGYLYFKATYYNSQDLDETDAADSEAVLADESMRYTSIYAIRVQAGLTQNPYITDERIERKRKQAENEINSVLLLRYTLPLEEVPPLIQRICELLAGGYIDFEEFGKDGEGVKWLGEARGLLNSIKKGTQRLVGADGTELSVVTSTNRLRGYPDNEGDDETPPRMFSVDKTF